MAFNRTRVKTADRVLEDAVRESVVDQELGRLRRKWLAVIAAVVLVVGFVLLR